MSTIGDFHDVFHPFLNTFQLKFDPKYGQAQMSDQNMV